MNMRAQWLVLVITSILFLGVLGESEKVFALDPTFPSTINLSDNPGLSRGLQISNSGDDVFTVWQDNESGNSGILFKKISNGGSSISNTINLRNTDNSLIDLGIASSGSNVYVVWFEHQFPNVDLFFTKSNDGGQTFDEPVSLPISTTDARSLKIATYGNNVYVIWQEGPFGNFKTLFTASIDNGQTFTVPKIITDVFQNPTILDLAAFENNVYVTWNTFDLERNVFFAASSDNGQNFDTETLTTSGDALYPSLHISGNDVYVLWTQGVSVPSDIFLKKITNNGSSFGDTINLSNSIGRVFHPDMTTFGSDVYVIWSETSLIIAAESDLFLTKSIDGGQTFDEKINVSNSPGGTARPKILASNDLVFVTWADSSSGTGDAFFSSSTDGGASFSAGINLSSNAENLFESSFALSNNNVLVFWIETNTRFFTNADIFLAISTDDGKSFGNTLNISNIVSRDFTQQIAASGNHAYVVWINDIPKFTKTDVLFRNSDDGGVSFDYSISLNGGSRKATNPQITVNDNYVYVVWEEARDIHFIKSNDNGQNFGFIRNLSTNSGESFSPNVASFENNVYIVWVDETMHSNGDILFVKSSNYGQNFDAIYQLDMFKVKDPKITAFGNYVYITWLKEKCTSLSCGFDDLYIAASNDFGQNFVVTKLSNSAFASSLEHQLITDGNSVFVVWKKLGDIFFTKSNDGGKTFDESINLSNTFPIVHSFDPQISLSGNNLYVVWWESLTENCNIFDYYGRPSCYEIFFIKSENNGESFGDILNLSNNPELSKIPKIAVIENEVLVTWVDDDNDSRIRDEISFIKSSDGGETFGEVINLSQNIGDSDKPQIAVSEDNVYVGWIDNTIAPRSALNDEVFLIRSNQRGDDFGITNNPPDCSQALPNLNAIWPPNHKLVEIFVEGVIDVDDDPVTIIVDKITQDEATNGLGDGDISPDGFGVGTDTAQVRAERSGTGDGRVYEILFTADDGNGGTCQVLVNVDVPQDKKDTSIDSGQNFDSTQS